MKSSKAQTHARFHKIPRLEFEKESRLTSYAGLVVYQALFVALDLKRKLRRCFSHLAVTPIYGHAKVMLLLVVHLLLGFRQLRGMDYYRGDPLVARIVGLRRLPDVSTVSRTLATMDAISVDNVRQLVRDEVLQRLTEEGLARITVDFDGSVQSTCGHAEGTAVGFNKKKKGARSYYPLFCTVAQTGQFLDMHHRPGNVHDSNGAPAFMIDCIRRVRRSCPRATLESRIDSAFFNDDVIDMLQDERVEFSCSVPFERFVELKQIIEQRQRWRRMDSHWSYFEKTWKPKAWSRSYRFLFLRQRTKKQQKGPLQLDLFVPRDYEYEYKVIVTNKQVRAKTVLYFHHGRGAQEKIFGEAKQNAAVDLVATKRRVGNEIFTLAGMLAHNLSRELQMRTHPLVRPTEPKRPARWNFLELGTIRQRLLHQAGRLTRPQGELTLTIGSSQAVRKELLEYLEALRDAA